MKRFYVVPEATLFERVAGCAYPHHDLFISAGGAHWIPLGDTGLVLLCCGGFSDAEAEKRWHTHREVARLQHPIQDTEVTFGQLMARSGKQFLQKHLDALGHLGIGPQHRLSDLDRAARRIHPLVSLGTPY